MKLVCISDTHGDHEQLVLPEGDILLHAGDVTAHGQSAETQDFMQWLGSQRFAHKLCIAGNHDAFMEEEPDQTAAFAAESGVKLLNDSGCFIDGIQFWGSPITPRFFHWHFMRDPGADIEAHWNLIPKHTDVLITHGPVLGILDEVERPDEVKEHVGCPSLKKRLKEVGPLLHLFGHIHEARGQYEQDGVRFYNISSMNKHYRIAHEPVVIELTENKSGEPV